MWVYRVAHNTALSYLAGQTRRSAREQTLPTSVDPAGTANPERDALAREKQQ